MATGDAKPRVLVVDDDVANLRTFRIVFREEFEIELASDAAAAMRALGSRAFDVALADYSMPDVNGLELLRRMRAAHARVRRIIVTGYPDLPELADASRSGLVDAVVTKPWSRSELQRTIADVVRGGAGGPIA